MVAKANKVQVTSHANVRGPVVIENSATVAINSQAQKKRLSGIKVFNLSVGEPKLAMHPLLVQAAIDAMQQQKIFYPPPSGFPELKSAAASWMNETYDCTYQSDNCLVVSGGKFGIYLLMQLMLNQGDEVMIVSPYWVSYPAIVKLFGGIPVIINTDEEDNWKLTTDKLKQALTKKTKILIINNGTNPTGTLYSQQELADILSFAKANNLTVISDEVYSGLTYDNYTYVSCGSFTDYKDNVIVIQSCSKNFAMTGWRIGFVFGNTDIINHLTALVGQSTSGVTTVSQFVAKTAIDNAMLVNTAVRQAMLARRDLMLQLTHKLLAINVPPPLASLYLFISLNDLGVKNLDSCEFCTKVLMDADVALVPGASFGKEGYIRISFGENENDLVGGMTALASYLKKTTI